ncbi:hypothetical protein PFISCL1PPCAC_14037, partial [Pristionchus fissidentatus]
LTLIAFDIFIISSFTTALSLGALTYAHIKQTKKMSEQTRRLELKLLIAVVAQTVVPLIFVYIPYFCCLSFPFLRIPAVRIGEICTLLIACFPAWDAVIVIGLIPDYQRGISGIVKRRFGSAT